MFRKWEELPDFMRLEEIRPYWEVLNGKKREIAIKRFFDYILALALLILLSVPMLIIALLIKLDSPGPAIFRQERVTSYGRRFRIHKFRTMVSNADRIGAGVTVSNDSRITRVGSRLRKLRLDELPQLLDVLSGDMSFVGTRPETVKYVARYRPLYNATLLLPAGITSEASIRYKDEDRLLQAADDVDRVYLDRVLPEKMKWNLLSIERFSLWNDFCTMIRTVSAVFRSDDDREKGD